MIDFQTFTTILGISVGTILAIVLIHAIITHKECPYEEDNKE